MKSKTKQTIESTRFGSKKRKQFGRIKSRLSFLMKTTVGQRIGSFGLVTPPKLGY